jgi:predicted DNA-binding protein
MKEITHLAEEYGTSQARVVRELIKLGLEKIQRGYLFTIAKEHD